MMMSGKDFLKSHALSWRRKVYSDWEDVTDVRAWNSNGGQIGGQAWNRGHTLLEILWCPSHCTDVKLELKTYLFIDERYEAVAFRLECLLVANYFALPVTQTKILHTH